MSRYYVGLDVHKASISIAVLGQRVRRLVRGAALPGVAEARIQDSMSLVHRLCSS